MRSCEGHCASCGETRISERAGQWQSRWVVRRGAARKELHKAVVSQGTSTLWKNIGTANLPQRTQSHRGTAATLFSVTLCLCGKFAVGRSFRFAVILANCFLS